ncbi:MAG TPA: DNA internalization-related competence protein ComEC/Rec2 [Gammaproteobacteria bacterium]|nr:DNA internalization-related competence protein ComEC/Rec2 [Gammaproteobacteria bacterium]
MRRMALGFLIGVVGMQQLSVLPGTLWSLGLLLGLLALGGLLRARLRGYWLIPLAAGLGFCWASLAAQHLLAGGLPGALEGQDVQVTGYVASLPERQGRRLRFRFAPDSLRWQDLPQAVPGTLLLSWYPRKARPIPELHVGERWQLRVRLKRPHGFANPGGFDYEAWLFRQGIRAKGYVRWPKGASADTPPVNRRLALAGRAFWLDQQRERLRGALLNALDGHPLRGIVLALAMGDRQFIDTEQWQVFTRTGTNHLVAISGLHVGLVAGLVFFLARRLWRLSARAVNRWPANKAGALGALLAATVYAALAGFSIPTQRALIMVAVVMLAVLAQRHTRPSSLLALALLIVLIIDPLAVLAAGFWLSFGAVALILYGMSGRLAMKSLWWRWGRVQWLVALGLLPLLLWQFQQASLVAPLANLLAVPWVSMVTVPLTLLGSLALGIFPAAGEGVLHLAGLSLEALWWWLQWLAQWPRAAWAHMAPPGWAMVVAGLGILWLLAPRGVPARWVGAVGLMPLLFVSPAAIPEGQARFTLLDVGQGLAAVVQTRRHVLVFDAGPRFSSGFNTGEAVVAPYLRAHGRRKIDTLLVSHGDNDHIGGVAGLRKHLPVERVLSSVPQKMAGAEPCVAGQYWQWDGVRFTMLNPADTLKTARRSDNNRSCVLRVQAGGQSLLLSGDIERSTEAALVREFAEGLRSDVLVAPHHGSLTSSSPGFVAAVAPAVVLFPVGYGNRYGFPKPRVVQRYAGQGARLFDTAQQGAIELVLGGGEGVPGVRVYRQQERRYWHKSSSEPLSLP